MSLKKKNIIEPWLFYE